MGIQSSVPIPPGLQNHAVVVPQSGEWIDKVLWDTQLYTDNVTTFLDFFTALPANIENGNLDQAGIVGGNRYFVIRAIGVFFRSLIAGDIRQLAKNGLLRLFIGNKDYSEWPISMLPPGGGVFGILSQTNAAAVQAVSHGVPDPRSHYTLARPLLIDANLNFRIRCEWPVAQNISGNTNVTVLLKGEVGRNIQ